MRHPILTNISPIFYSSTTTYHSKVELEDSAIMAPKGGNAKKEAGRAKKAENEAKKAEAVAAERERKEAAEWIDPMSKSSKSKAEKEEKRKADLARKAENARLLDEEEKGSAAKVKSAPKAGAKKKAAEKPAGPGALAAGGGLDAVSTKDEKPGTEAPKEVESYAATGIDNMLDLLEVVNAKTDKASVGAQAAGIERHPERRFKAAFEAYSERELPQLRKDYPGLRLQQYKDLLYKQFQKSEENPFNQTTVAYNASKDEKVSALKDRQKGIEERLRED
ncbi:hmg-box variant [Moniliophthora roreri MCA 2997]|uniref:Hmg-box variant n=1 Tax=Moniliophthora roreri (strain MCA 2997) TaxID=1381753 RepID=V2WZC2_MONRO|nr:hmg-box variant [Moniliophthora roreri MCA 2997]